MRTDLVIAGTLAALVVGGLALAVHHTRAPELGRADAVAVRELQLRDRPEDSAPSHGFIAQGSPVRVEGTAAPGWVYVYQQLGTGDVLQGYVRATSVAPPGTPIAAQQLAGAATGQFQGLVRDRPFRSLPVFNLPPAPAPPAPPPVVVRPPAVFQPPVIASTPPAVPIQPAPRAVMPWLTAPLSYLTGELPRGAAADMLVAEAESARARLNADFNREGGAWLRSLSTFRSFDDQASIVAGVLRSLGLGQDSDADAIRRGLLQSLTTRSIPGFSRHHWGTDVDVLSSDSRAWRPGGELAQFTLPLEELAPAHGLYHPYRDGAYPEPARPHYNAEPWHLSLMGPGEQLRQRWLSEIGEVPAQYDALLDRAAQAIASRAGVGTAQTRQALGAIDLASYVRNVAPVPTGVSA